MMVSKMIQWKHGNIFDSDCSILVNPVNCVGVADKGLAAQFKDHFPESFTIYQLFCKYGLLKNGLNPTLSVTNFDDKMILLFPTQDMPKNPAKLQDIEASLALLRLHIDIGEYNDYSIAFPKIGCGLGGLDWKSEVKPLIKKYLNDVSIPIEVYE